jgi:hypothetical protein
MGDQGINNPSMSVEVTPMPVTGASGDKCAFRSCKVRAVKLQCAASGCQKEIHLMCYHGLVVNKFSIDALPNGRAACTKKCHDKAMRELSGGGEDQDEGARVGKWDCDGKGGPDDPLTSMQILLDWWMEEGNYSKFCGKNNDGVKKIQFANILAEKMTKETVSKRDGKNVLNKIQHMERTWRLAHSFATSETGAGIKDGDGEVRFNELVIKRCPFYFDLLDIMADRASSEPRLTNYSAIETPTADGDFSDMSDEGEVEAGDEGQSVTTKRSSVTGTSSKKKKPRKSPTFMDENAISALTAGNAAMEKRMDELVRHNKVVENMESRRFQLEEHRLNLEQNKFKSMSWQGKNDELNYKMNLLARYEHLKSHCHWTDQQILAFCPDMEQVIAAKAADEPPPTLHLTYDEEPSQDDMNTTDDILGQQTLTSDP